MLEIILLVAGVVSAERRSGLVRLAAVDYPAVDPVRFGAWRAARIAAIDAFLWATWGALVIKLVITTVVDSFATEMALPSSAVTVVEILTIGGWIAGLIAAGVQDRNASKLRAAAGVDWPKVRGDAGLIDGKSVTPPAVPVAIPPSERSEMKNRGLATLSQSPVNRK
jgi:hypothetical protein